MLATSAGYQQMIAGHTITSSPVRIQITLPSGLNDVSATVTAAQVQASITTDMPDGTRFEVGYPAMQLTFTLADVAGLFAPYNQASALYRKPPLKAAVTADWGTPTGTSGAVEWLRKFTGQVDTYVCNDDGSVNFTCVDNRSLLRASVMTSAVVTAPPFNAGLTSEFALDYLLRAASNGAISSWPAQRSQCVLAVGMRSSVWPEVGTLNTADFGGTQAVPSFAPGAMGTGLAQLGTGAPQPTLQYFLAQPIGTSLYFECWVNGMTSGGAALTVDLGTTVDNDNIEITVQNTVSVSSTAGGTFGTPLVSPTFSSAAHRIGVAVTLPAVGAKPCTATIYVDRTSVASGSINLPFNRTGTPYGTCYMTIGGTGGTFEAVQVTLESSPTIAAFTPAAVLDPSLNTLDVLPALDGTSDTWTVIQQLADAELGVAGMDESTGNFFFKNRNTLRTSASVRTVTSSVSLVTLDIELSAASLYNKVQVPYQGWNFGTAGLAYTFTSAWKVPARGTWTRTVQTSTLVAQVDGTIANLPNGHTTTDGNSYFRASLDKAGVNEHPGAVSGALTASAVQTAADQVTVTVTNSSGQDAELVSSAHYTDIAAGTAALWIGATPVTAGDILTVDTGTTFKTNPTDLDVTYQAAANPWLQDDATAAALAFHLGDDLSNVRPMFTQVDIVPDPSIQLCDRLILVDPDVTGINEHVVLWGWTLTQQNGQDSMSIDARAVAAPGQWILEVAGRSELNLTTFI